ncbi:hypothetical protein RFI_21200 [Reticulomyxa filosa]|uniref:Uncharacterized protein n=1 Tax=Reticulomyxa filosa TaxID=46433 RepID=X6MRS5_RETFI|nr:hypothetical protein RFI_21200 [Reticulomyxa filosa]|eukprot:ETO16157.1 hypothetical protein RFI_21200 [Reticulomyxa filosa]
MFDKNKFSQELYRWLGLLTLIHEMLLIPRFWFLYFDWRLGMDLNKLEWKQQLFLGKWQLHNQAAISPNPRMSISSQASVDFVVVNKDLNATTTIATTCNEDKDGNIITDKKEDNDKDSSCEMTISRQRAGTTTLPNGKVEVQLMPDDQTNVAMPETSKIDTTVLTFPKHEQVLWTLRYRRFLGDTRIVLALDILYFALFIVGSMFMHFLEDVFDSFIYLTVFIAVTNLLLFTCAYKIKTCRDLLEIHSFFFFF